ncbi:MAG: DnaJ domain-containing protein [Candidatus Odinarchaeota archaeon]
MLLNEDEWCQAMLGSESMKTYKEYLYDCYMLGDSVKEIAKIINRSTSTVYRYINEMHEKIRYPQMKNEIRSILLCGNFTKYVNELSYRDVCLLARRFQLYGTTRKDKINSILKYFKSYSILGIFPENLSKAIVKKAYKKRARETHPDLNKNFDKAGKEFIEVQRAYNQIIAEVI